MKQVLAALLKTVLEVFLERKDQRETQERLTTADQQEVHHDFEQNAREAEDAAAQELADDDPRDLTQRLREQGL
ncbi:hypothetical protein [Pseudovibrio sp. POLY-S9]|uniref:hypothetical protein n=1 Tax=Pseudovibrio sp. POLY-S9 TaxID=1576596 RepID=UPI00128F792C|nr:hypothetical protein [Pseudovibrio sp. POLY-S9]